MNAYNSTTLHKQAAYLREYADALREGDFDKAASIGTKIRDGVNYVGKKVLKHSGGRKGIARDVGQKLTSTARGMNTGRASRIARTAGKAGMGVVAGGGVAHHFSKKRDEGDSKAASWLFKEARPSQASRKLKQQAERAANRVPDALSGVGLSDMLSGVRQKMLGPEAIASIAPTRRDPMLPMRLPKPLMRVPGRAARGIGRGLKALIMKNPMATGALAGAGAVYGGHQLLGGSKAASYRQMADDRRAYAAALLEGDFDKAAALLPMAINAAKKGFGSKLLSGAKNVAGTAWRGAKAAPGAALRGAKAVGRAPGSVVAAGGRALRNSGRDSMALAQNAINGAPTANIMNMAGRQMAQGKSLANAGRFLESNKNLIGWGGIGTAAGGVGGAYGLNSVLRPNTPADSATDSYSRAKGARVQAGILGPGAHPEGSPERAAYVETMKRYREAGAQRRAKADQVARQRGVAV